MTNGYHEIETQLRADAVVIGGGLAGLAAALHLSRAGFEVICLEPREHLPRIVGESLDWSAPQLFAQLGLPMEQLVEQGAATFKRHITVTAADGHREEFLPGAWLSASPWNVEVRTLHLDRMQIHTLLAEAVREQGTVTLRERAVGIETEDGRIVSVRTASGESIAARWFLDASGAAASVLGREFGISSASYGPRKISLWAHFKTDEWVEGTTLYTLSPPGEYMEWIWEIPVRPGVSSIGYVAPGAKAKRERAAGLSNGEILANQMRKFPRLEEICEQAPLEEVAATSFLCRTYSKTCGPNWMILGEAASQSDPITGNGVTAALRHAAESTALIVRYRQRGDVPMMARAAYNLRVSGMGRYFNSLIEKLYYESPLRSRLGIFNIANIYTVPAWLTNLIYSRTRPRRILGTLVLCAAMITLRGIAWSFFKIGNALDRRSRRVNQRASGSLTTGGGSRSGRKPLRALQTPK